MTNLEPDVLFSQWPRRIIDNVFEALRTVSLPEHVAHRVPIGMPYLKTGGEFLLLLVDYTKAEVDLVGFLEVRLHAHDLRKGLFGVL